ncbi:hypothetical protein [Jatrophihabitans sp.]|uniref:hypothetical protein n=1 Tax=Jatrophihabitans sp. TaxID=1932789 RepID=UPI002B69623D|nr:hypothetical protein [Jatrophihabitans sp.]
MTESQHSQQPPEPSDSETLEPPSSPSAGPRRQAGEDLLPQRSSDEAELGWGDRPDQYGDDWYLAERPPHHG